MLLAIHRIFLLMASFECIAVISLDRDRVTLSYMVCQLSLSVIDVFLLHSLLNYGWNPHFLWIGIMDCVPRLAVIFHLKTVVGTLPLLRTVVGVIEKRFCVCRIEICARKLLLKHLSCTFLLCRFLSVLCYIAYSLSSCPSLCCLKPSF